MKPLQEKNKQELLNDLKQLVEILKASCPRQVPIRISKAIDPCRALVLREALRYRMIELTESAYEDFEKDRMVASVIMCRALQETESLFWEFIKQIQNSLEAENIEKTQKFLNKALLGAKAKRAKKQGEMPDPNHVLDLIRGMADNISCYEDHYELQSEIAHPNAAGIVESYVTLDWDKGLAFLGRKKDRAHGNLSLPLLICSLNAFISEYNRSAELLVQFKELCERLLENSRDVDPLMKHAES